MTLPELVRFLGTRKGEFLFLSISCVLTLAYRGWHLFTTVFSSIPATSHISYDGVYYAQIARNILCGTGLGWEAMKFPVLQPMLVAGASCVTGVDNLAVLAQAVNLAAGVLMLFPAYYLAKDCFGVKAAVATLLILIPYPHILAISNSDTAESLYSFLAVLSIFVAGRALSLDSGKLLFLAGLCLGTTYLARPEGLNIFVLFMAVAGWRISRKNDKAATARKLGIALAGFAIFALPYVVFLTNSYGRVVLSSKLPFESVVMNVKVYGELLEMEEVEGITPSGRLAWQEKGGAGLVFRYFADNPARFMRTYLENLASELPWRVLNSSHMEGYPIVYPLYFWFPAIFGMVLLVGQPSNGWKAVLLWVPFVNLFVYPVFTKGFWIYHVPYIPFLVILAAGGYSWMSDRIKSHTGVAVPLVITVALLWAGYSTYTRFTTEPEKVDVVNYRTTLSEEAMKAGEDARSRLGEDACYMMQWSRLVYYLGGRWLCLPSANTVRTVEYAMVNGADYIVEELEGDAYFSGSQFSGTPGLRPVYAYESKRAPYMVIIWEVPTPGRRTKAGQAAAGRG